MHSIKHNELCKTATLRSIYCKNSHTQLVTCKNHVPTISHTKTWNNLRIHSLFELEIHWNYASLVLQYLVWFAFLWCQTLKSVADQQLFSFSKAFWGWILFMLLLSLSLTSALSRNVVRSVSLAVWDGIRTEFSIYPPPLLHPLHPSPSNLCSHFTMTGNPAGLEGRHLNSHS